MKDPRTTTLLYEAIEEEYSWRIKELSQFKSSTLSAKGGAQKGMIRAGIALLYAHWEGFIKKVADLYYEFVSYQNCRLKELSDCFVSIVLRGEIERLQESRKMKIHNEVMNMFFERQDQTANFSKTSPFRTSNLKYELFEDVCIMIGVKVTSFHERYKRSGYDWDIQKTIDKDLVERRNSVAHGDYISVTEKEYKELYDVIINGLLRTFKEAVMDAAQNKQYKRNGGAASDVRLSSF